MVKQCQRCNSKLDIMNAGVEICGVNAELCPQCVNTFDEMVLASEVWQQRMAIKARARHHELAATSGTLVSEAEVLENGKEFNASTMALREMAKEFVKPASATKIATDEAFDIEKFRLPAQEPTKLATDADIERCRIGFDPESGTVL